MTVQWTGTGNADSWDIGGNWPDHAAPAFYADVMIGVVKTSITLLVASAAAPRAANLTIGNGAADETVRLDLAGNFNLNGGTLSVTAGATMITEGGTVSLGGGSLSIGSGASYTEIGGSLAASSLTNDGTLRVGGAMDLAGEAIFGNGTIDVSGGSLGTARTLITVYGNQAFTIENGGTLALRSSLGTSAINFGTGLNTLITQGNQGYFTAPISGFGYGSSIEVEQADIDTRLSTLSRNVDGSYSMTLYQTGNPYYAPVVFTHVTFAAGISSPHLDIRLVNGETIITLACFLSGTRIATMTGDLLVETIAAQDMVVAIENGERTHRAVRWHGSRIVDLDLLDTREAAELAPIRIRAHAFATDMPIRDLLITPDHCILVDGGLVPARMLVNGSSIVQDFSMRHYTVHHIECDIHSILLSENLTTESYLDTGNRDSFGTTGDDTTRRPQSWADAAAPLTTDRAVVEPIWRHLVARAELLGIAGTSHDHATTTDAQLMIRLADGSLVRQIRRNGDQYFFVMPAGTSSATILSRVFVPALVDGPFADDRRRLGVAVSMIRLWTGLQTETLAIETCLPGWHQREPGAQAVWTDGAGLIATGARTRSTVLELTILMAGTYLFDQPAERSRAA